MSSVVLRSCPAAPPSSCGLCGQSCVCAGLHLFHVERRRPLCSCCGRHAAPELAALVGLATIAARVARIGHHTVTPPLSALLELARAAESYAAAATPLSPQIA